jgi:energy-coupling factor transporter ATP-binding protein EcfA2
MVMTTLWKGAPGAMPEGDFSSTTKDIIAKRAGYICSFPNCGRLLVGPSTQPTRASFVGHVAHIFPSAAKGPRADYGISKDQLQSPHNGILLCAHHHSVVDSDHGRKYSPSVLRSFKDIHEQRISFMFNQYSSPIGWIDQISIAKSPIFEPGVDIRFGKITLIYGDNGAGKTAICDLLRGSFNPTGLVRWFNREFEYSLSYFSPSEHQVNVRLKNNKITYTIDKEEMFLNPYNISIVSPVERPRWLPEDDEFSFLSRMLSIDEVLLLNMIQDKSAIGGITFKDYELQSVLDDDRRPVRQLSVTFLDGSNVSYGMLSAGEKSCCQLDLSISLAQFLAKYKPCSLVLDTEAVHSIDTYNTKRYIEYLSSSSVRFQTIWVSPAKEPKIDWTGWQIAKVVGSPPRSNVFQDEI